MSNEAHSPYLPNPMHVLQDDNESNDHSLKTLELSFDDPQDAREFFAAYNPGQFCLLSVIGTGESALGIASAAWEGDFVRFTVQKMGSVTMLCMNSNPAIQSASADPLAMVFRWKIGKARTWSSSAAGALFRPSMP